MSRVVAYLAIAGLGGVLANQADDCAASGSCNARAEEDVAMLQFARLGHDHPKGRSFSQSSKPYFAKDNAEMLAAEQGALIIDEDGALNTYYLPGATVVDDGRTVEYRPPYRFYLMREPTTDYSDASKFYKPDFPGKTFSVDMNFGASGPGCGCNLNFYLVDMPVPSAGKDSDHYCDAQCFEGLGCCAEFDMNEGNNQVQQITNHACTHHYNGHPDWACHKWGEPEAKTHGNSFGPGAGHTIDSTKLFTFSQRFDVNNGNDFTFTTTMSQEGREVSYTMGPGNEELNAMLQVLQKGMAFVTGYWFAQDMNWMDGETCGGGVEHCNMNPVKISNWRLTSNDGPAPAPSPGPAPGPAPLPTPPAAGHCCWGGGCSGCNSDPSNYCNAGQDRCEGGCGGQWC